MGLVLRTKCQISDILKNQYNLASNIFLSREREDKEDEWCSNVN